MWRARTRAAVFLTLSALLCAAEKEPVQEVSLPAPAVGSEQPLLESKPAREVTPEYLEELDRQLAEKKVELERLRKEQKHLEEVAHFPDRVFEDISAENYAGALVTLEQWARVDPEDTRVASLQTLVRKMAEEEDQKKKTELLGQYLDVVKQESP